MNDLPTKYRPRTWTDVIGQPKAIAQLDTLRAHGGLAGRAYWISGASGIGKTTIARLIAAEVAGPDFVTEVDAKGLTASDIDAFERDSHYFGWGPQIGRAYILNEAHFLTRGCIGKLLVTLERIPDHAAWILTTTKEGELLLLDDNIDAHPLVSRCNELRLTNQGIQRLQAARCREIAIAEGLDGADLPAYLRLAKDTNGNMRQQLQRIGCGLMAKGA